MEVFRNLFETHTSNFVQLVTLEHGILSMQDTHLRRIGFPVCSVTTGTSEVSNRRNMESFMEDFPSELNLHVVLGFAVNFLVFSHDLMKVEMIFRSHYQGGQR